MGHMNHRDTHAHVELASGQESPNCMHMSNGEDWGSHNVHSGASVKTNEMLEKIFFVIIIAKLFISVYFSEFDISI